jgi:hypothetical protein
MRTFKVLAALAVVALPLSAQTTPKPGAMAHDDHDMTVAGGGTLPAGWAGRTDGASGAMTNVKFVTMGPGYHVTLGPATILYRASDAVNGPFHTLATFTQTTAPKHPEGYGLFYGGRNLTEPTEQYTYFLVRGDGKFLIKRRDGANTSLVKDWTESPAVVKADSATGKATNKLEIDQKSDAKHVRFLVNGQEVYSMDAAGNNSGIVGLRVNHNLDLHIADFAVHK